MKAINTSVRSLPNRRKASLLLAVVLVLGIAPWTSSLADPEPPQKDMRVDAAMRKQIVDGLITNLNQHYVFPEKAKAIEMLLRAKQQHGAYDAISSAEQLASVLTTDLQGITKDIHLEVEYSEEEIPEETTGDAPSAEEKAMELVQMKKQDFGIEAVERLKFNIGYLDLRAFAPPELVKSRIAAAMTLLGDTQALIIDLRRNRGGEPDGVALLASYLFEQRTHLNDIYLRDGDRTEQHWTSDKIDGPRYGATRKVYILTSHNTVSAGEDFAYALKNLKRATLVGESTAGGAHPGEPRRLSPHFDVFVPSGRSISPITHTDWEGIGVKPDIKAPAKDALNVAQILILRGFLATERDSQEKESMVRRLNELK